MRIGHQRNTSPAALAGAVSSMNGRGSEKLVGQSGEINAGSLAELASQVSLLASRMNEAHTMVANDEAPMTVAERRAELAAAYNDSARWLELGSDIVADISDRVTRMGFARRFMVRGDLQQGSIPRVRMRRRNVEAVLATGPTQVGTQIIRDLYLYPNEFYVIANIFVEQREISQGNSDVLEEKYLDCLEAILVQEDRTFLKLAKRTAGMENEVQYFSGALTPAVVAKTQEQIGRWSLPVGGMLVSYDLLTDMNVGSGFNDFWDPVSRLEIILTGKLGNLFGMEMITDGFRDPRLKVLDPGEFLIFSAPDYIGAYTDRGPVQSEMSTGVQKENRVGKGWYCFEELSMAVANARGVAIAKRT